MQSEVKLLCGPVRALHKDTLQGILGQSSTIISSCKLTNVIKFEHSLSRFLKQEQGKFLVLRASAGSGKTYRLVHEYLLLALGHNDPGAYRRILAVTFTNKAAQEMLERVLDRMAFMANPTIWEQDRQPSILCEELGISKQELGSRALRCLEHMLHNYGDLGIKTMDSFANRVVRAFAHDLGIPAEYEIELDKEHILQEAVDRVIGSLERGSSITKALVQLMLHRNESERSWRVEKELFTTANSVLDEEGHRNLIQQRAVGLEAYLEAGKRSIAAVKAFEQRLTAIGRKALELMKPIPSDRFAAGASGLPTYFRRMARLEGKYPASATLVNNMAEGKWYATKATAENKAAINGIKEQLLSLYAQSVELLENEYPTYVEHQMIGERMVTLGVLGEVENALQALKDEKDQLLISDLNRIISETVLDNPAPFIYERIGERYRHLLFDEFQDTSLMQWQNFLPLVENALANNGFNLVVGDGKQAIYRWRSGEVQQFLELPSIFGKELPAQAKQREAILQRHFQEELLDTNRRSSPEVINFNNQLFMAMRGMLPAHLRGIYADTEQRAHRSAPGYVHMEEVQKDLAKSAKERILDRTVEVIGQLLERGFQQKDICVLVRNNTNGPTIADHLSGMEINGEIISVISPQALLLGNHPDVAMLMDALAALYDNQDLASATRFLGAVASRKAPDDPDGLIRGYLRQHGRETMVDLELLLEELYGLERVYALRSLPSYELAMLLADRLGLLVEKGAYMSALLNAILDLNKQRGSGPFELLDWWEKEGEKLGLSIPEDQNAVRLMTVHKSKGLQFPAVIMPFADYARVKKSGDDLWLKDREKKHGMENLLVTTASKLSHTRFGEQYAEELQKQELDSLNILYVAFTRAERTLVAFFDKPTDAKICKPMVEAMENMEGWDEANRSFTSGHIPNLDKERQDAIKDPSEHSTPLHLRPIQAADWRERAIVSSSSDVVLPQLERGKLLHTLMDQISRRADIKPVLERASSNGQLTDENLSVLGNILEDLLEQIGLDRLLDDGFRIFDERSLLTEEGDMLRPDRVLLKGKEAVILEFKTGEERSEHLEQVARYTKALVQMGYEVTDSCLLYLDKGKMLRA